MFDKNRNSGTYSEIDVVKKTIDKANTANLLDILYAYNINIDRYNRKACCPFHKNGQERSASFFYYPDTNTYYCFGCKLSGSAVDFVATIENINNYSAAQLINNNYTINHFNVPERGENNSKIYLEFSHLVREFIVKNVNNDKALKYAEHVCEAFDKVRFKYVIDPNGLRALISKLKNKLNDFET
jgi:DNA primase